MSATLFNLTPAEIARAPKRALPAAVRRVMIVGGGTAGWMAALILARTLIEQGVEITVVESPNVGIIGVGEGSTPWLRGFFDSLDIEEAEWMPECHATYKCGITFDKWSTKPGFESYFHPFASMLDNLTMTQFVHNADARVNGADVHAHPDRFFIATRLARGRLAPKAAEHFPFDIWHGYHFDSVLLGQFLHKKALQRGVRYRTAHVARANLDSEGAIASVATAEGETLCADIFVDCSGFAGLLIDQALKTPFVSFAENLFNDAAIAIPSAIGESLPSETVSTALKAGWAWKIPLTSRFGNGYVYSTQFCTPDAAEFELREHLGLLESPTPARHLKMKIGRVTKHWNKNCLALGLSQGFIEPLEATALLFIQQTATAFAECLDQGDLSDAAHDRFNTQINEHFEGIRDYIVTHYKTNSRTDTEYWRANAANRNLSDSLKQLLSLWMSGKGISAPVRQKALGKGYPVFSWYSIMSGMGIFPDRESLHPPKGREAQYRLGDIDNLLDRSTVNYRDHREVLANIPPRRMGESLQVYFLVAASTQSPTGLREFRCLNEEAVRRDVLRDKQPAVIRGLVENWVAVREGRESSDRLIRYLKQFDSGKPVDALLAPPEVDGQISYNATMTGFNFVRNRLSLNQVAEQALRYAKFPKPPSVAVQSALIRECVPGFEVHNHLDILPHDVAPRIWLGNRITTPTHVDEWNNVGCVVAGRRRFTLFPPDQIANLYIGPLDFAPTGAAMSLVSLRKPDFERYPKFREALAAAQVADLGRGMQSTSLRFGGTTLNPSSLSTYS